MACLLVSPTAECEHVLMADLVPGDLVLGREGATRVVAVQHKAIDTIGEMTTLHTADGKSLSMTLDHAVFVAGVLVAAADAKVGAALTNAKGATANITRITNEKRNIINVVTVDGTIVANGLLAASNPLWIAALTVDAPLRRTVVNALLYAAGDVASVTSGFARVTIIVVTATAKVAATFGGAILAARTLRARKASA